MPNAKSVLSKWYLKHLQITVQTIVKLIFIMQNKLHYLHVIPFEFNSKNNNILWYEKNIYKKDANPKIA